MHYRRAFLTILDCIELLRNDFRLIASTINLGYPSHHVYPSHITKDLAILLKDNSLLYKSNLVRSKGMHGRIVLFDSNEIFENPSPIHGPVSEYAKLLGFYEVFKNGKGQSMRPLISLDTIEDLVYDGFLYSEETKLLGKLNLKDKIVLAGHRTRQDTLETFSAVVDLTSFNLISIREAIVNKRPSGISYLMNKINTCTKELVLKVGAYPKLSERLALKLDYYPTIAAPMLVSELQKDQGDFRDYVLLSEAIKAGTYMLRSVLYDKGLYTKPSMSVEAAYSIFRNACTRCEISAPSIQELSKPLVLIDLILSVLTTKRIYGGC
jgi:hypothetical protein